MPGSFFQVEALSGLAPNGPRTASPSLLGTRKNSQTILPVFASSANMCPLPPLKSLPALPTKTRPFQAIGADGTDSPWLASAICRFPHVLAGVEIVSKHPPVLGATKQHAVRVGDTAVHWNNA